MSQLTAQGFKRKRYEEIEAELQEKARELFGPNVDLTDRSTIGKIIKILAEREAASNELAEDVYNSDFHDTAEGVNLTRKLKSIGLSLNLEQKATGEVTFDADTGSSAIKGMIVGTETGVDFVTVEGGAEKFGKITVGIQAVNAGEAGNVAAGAITIIKTPVAGITAVTNEQPTTGGSDRETETEARARYKRSVARGGSGTVPAILAALLDMPDVKDALITENDENTALPNGQPPHSLAPLVYGGDDVEIAQTIFETKGGLRSWGTTVVNVTDSKGMVHQIGFSRPVEVPVWIRVTLTKAEDYPADGDDHVKTAIISYVGGTDADGTVYDGLGLDTDVIRYKVSSTLSDIPGIYDLVIETSLDGVTYTSDNVPISGGKVAVTDFNKVVIV